MAAVWGYFSQISVKKNVQKCTDGASGILHLIYPFLYGSRMITFYSFFNIMSSLLCLPFKITLQRICL